MDIDISNYRFDGLRAALSVPSGRQAEVRFCDNKFTGEGLGVEERDPS